MERFEEKTLSSKTVYKGKIFDITDDEIILSDGKKEYKRHREIIHHPGGVVILALKDDENVLLVKQYRYAVKSVQTELPAGRLEKGEDPLFAAKRELREETGYEGENSREIGSCFANPAILTNRVHTVLVENCIAKYPLQWDQGEDINIRLIPLCEIYDLILKGKIQHSLMITALFYYKLLTDIKK